MSKWSNYGRADSQLARDGDSRFTGLDMTRDRALLQEGTLAVSQNKRLRNGTAATRLGNIAASDFNAPFDNPIIGSAIYSNPNGDEIMLVATYGADFVWALQYGKDPYKINLATGETFLTTGIVEFCQAFDKVLLFRIPIGTGTLVWDGDPTHTFDVVTTPGPDTLIPSTWFGDPFQNRVLLYNPLFPALPWRDQIVMSDVLDYTQYDNILNVFRINSAESDYIVRVWPYYRGAVVVFKRRTIHMLQDFTFDPTFATQRMLSRRIGLASVNCIVEVGGDLMFLSEPGGIYRLSEIIQEQIVTEPEPVSDAIQPLIDRINWGQSSVWAQANALNDYAYFFVVLDRATAGGNNVALVHNVVSKQWESVDNWGDESFRISAVHAAQYDGVRSLYGVDYVNRKIYVLYKGAHDEINDDLFPINDVMETRGYTVNDPSGFKRFQRAMIGIRTSDPEITVEALTDGAFESKLLTESPLTKNRLKFYPHGHDDFSPGADNPREPYREDYSAAELSDFAGEDFDELAVGPISVLPATPLATIGVKTESLERMSVRTNGRWCSLRIANVSGNCDVLSVGVEAIGTMETKTAA